jgi:hypothetical protein
LKLEHTPFKYLSGFCFLCKSRFHRLSNSKISLRILTISRNRRTSSSAFNASYCLWHAGDSGATRPAASRHPESLLLAVVRHNIPNHGHELRSKTRPPEHHRQKRVVGDRWSGLANCGDTGRFFWTYLHIISARPSKQPLKVRTFLKVYMELCSYLFLQEQIKDIVITSLQRRGRHEFEQA